MKGKIGLKMMSCICSQLTQQPMPVPLFMRAGSVLQSASDMNGPSWLRKSLPEKKLKCYAWKKCWFILQSS
ncbi:hypothetical protein A6R68_07752 [Neotoma lepida]|uniref:Uncharacterized protein n=1 Tax=Neotoma lepida TaxID=56216 RepID=A0A1A6GEG2_NEOLE|nr:hypothetical protein A6R68_07752 [Neotoma lepida]